MEIEQQIESIIEPKQESNHEQFIYQSMKQVNPLIEQQKKQLFENLPPVVYSQNDKDFEQQFKVYLDLSKAYNNNDGEYFQSSFLNSIQSNKGYISSEDTIQKMKALHDIYEFGSNIEKDIYDPELITKECMYYDEIARQQLQQNYKILSKSQREEAALQEKTKIPQWDNPEHENPKEKLDQFAKLALKNKEYIQNKKQVYQ